MINAALSVNFEDMHIIVQKFIGLSGVDRMYIIARLQSEHLHMTKSRAARKRANK